MMRMFVYLIIAFFSGVLSAYGFIRFGGTLPIQYDNPALASLHISKPQVVGFLPYWLLSKADKTYSHYITTLTYFGLSLEPDGRVKTNTNPAEREPGWYALQNDTVTGFLDSAKQSGLNKSLLIISGDDGIIGQLLEDPAASARTMMRDIEPIMKEHGFTDLNLDIETFMDASPSARNSFTQFVATVKEELKRKKLGTLSIDLIPVALLKPKLYDAAALGSIADNVILMTYDYHYSGSYTSGAVAPLGGGGVTLEFDVETAVTEAMKVMPKEKILLGIPLYGYQWETIESATESATIPGGSETVSVRRVTELLRSCSDCVTGIDPSARSPYVVYPEGEVYKQAYFENEASLKEKLKLAEKYSLGGVAVWALGYEDDVLLRPLEAYKGSLQLSW